ncbi:MAG: hypothetical protein WC495_03875 [Patescibacteria group bacterium]|jgi:hypothetical protein
MLVQKRKKTRTSLILWAIVGVLVAVSVFLVYQNITSTGSTKTSTTTNTPISKLSIPTDFGQELFSDPRFNNIAAPDNQEIKQGTTYTDQLPVAVTSSTTLPTPEELKVFNPGYGGKLLVSWTASNIEGVAPSTALFKSSSGVSEFEQIAFLSSSTSAYTDSDVVNGQTYYYRVQSVLNVTQFTSKQLTVGQLDSDRGIRVDSFEGSNVVISWNAMSSDLAALQIQRIRSGVATILTTFTAPDDVSKITSNSSFIDSNAHDGDIYVLVGYSAYKTSEQSNAVQGTPTDSMAPTPPTDVLVQNAGDGNSVVISWTNPLDSDFDYVKIYRSSVQGVLGDVIKNTRSEYVQSVGECKNRKTVVDELSQNAETLSEGDCFINSTGISEGGTYYYTLTSVDTNGNESTSRIIGQIGRSNPFSSL